MLTFVEKNFLHLLLPKKFVWFMLPTGNQLSLGIRQAKSRRNKVAALQQAPLRKGIIYKIAVMSPRKPNSAKRTFAKVRVSVNQKRIFCKIPGIGDHFLQAHSVVLVRGHGPKDSPGINYHLIRGVYDFSRIETYGRKNRRSKFGVKNQVK
jgi:small subunit ribosomal protein S12